MEYYNLTYREYVLMRNGYEMRRSHEYEHTRLICYTLASAFRDPKAPLPSIQAFMPLPTDEDQVKAMEEDLNATRARLVEYYNRVYGKNLA